MTVLASRGSGTPTVTGTVWTNVANAIDGAPGTNPATNAQWENAVSAGVGTIEVSNYGFSSIPNGSVINSVNVSVRHAVSAISRFNHIRYQPYSGGSPIGSLIMATLNATAHNDASNFTVSLARLKAADFGVRVIATRASTTFNGYWFVDYIDVTVDYTFVPVGGKPKVYNGSTFPEKPAKIWTGSAWVEKPVKFWNGSAWVLA